MSRPSWKTENYLDAPLRWQRQPRTDRFAGCAVLFDGVGEVVVRGRVPNLIDLQISGSDDVGVEKPVLGHQGIDEQLASFGSICRMVIAELTIDRREYRCVHDAPLSPQDVEHIVGRFSIQCIDRRKRKIRQKHPLPRPPQGDIQRKAL